MSKEPEFITEVQLAQRQQRSVRTVQADRVKGGGIPFVKFGRCVRYRIDDVVAWEDLHRFRNTTEADKLKGADHD